MNEPELRHRLAAILAADAAEYSRLMAADERATLAALDTARAVFREQVLSNDGRVVDTAGDSVLAVFLTAAGAVNAALAIQQHLAAAARSRPVVDRMHFRVGIHLGDVLEKPDGSVYGDGVNIAARMQALCDAGGVTVSHTVHGAVPNRVQARFEDIGEQPLKHIKSPVRAFRLRAGPDAASPSGSAFRFGDVEVWPQQRDLRIAGEDATLGGPAFDLLLALIERRDQVVSRHELHELVWPGRVVEDNSLAVQMLALRKALGAEVIATVPGRGYRFTPILDEDSLPLAAVEAEPASRAPTGTAAKPLEPLAPPGAPPQMLGRDDDLAALEHLLAQHRCVTVAGAGGIGKTTLALVAAHARRGEHRDGTAWVDLSSISQPALVIAAVAQALQLSPVRGERSMPALLASLKPLQLLLVLDNAEHLADEVARLVDGIADVAPEVRVLVTSQVPLKVSHERVLRLGPLSVPESGSSADEAINHGAVALFVDQARAADPRFKLTADNVATVIDLCRHLDGVALAIKLAAARLSFFGLHGLEQRLAERLKLLAGGSRNTPTRQQTLRAALDWSYGLLSPQEQTTFRRLGAFAGGFTLELVSAVAGDEGQDEWTVIENVSSLVDRSLVSVDGGDPPRYRLLESARTYALAKLDEGGETLELRRRHARAMLTMSERSRLASRTLSDDEVFERHGGDVDNLRAAIDWSASHDPHIAIDLVGASVSIVAVLNLHREARRYCEALEPALATHPSRASVARFWSVWAVSHNTPTAALRACASKAAALFRDLGDEIGLHHALCYIGFGAFIDPEGAERALAEAATLERPGWPPHRLARRLYAQGFVHWANMQYALVHAAAEQTAALARSAGLRYLTALSSVTVATTALALGETEAALATSRSLLAEEAARRGGLLTYAWGIHASCLTGHGDLAEARMAWAEFFSRCRREDWERIHECSEGYVALALAEGRYAAAARLRAYWLGALAGRGWSPTVIDRFTRRADSLYGPALRAALGDASIERLMVEGRTLDAEAVCALTLEAVDRPP